MAMSSAENVAGSVTCVAAILRMQHVLFCGICVTYPPLCGVHVRAFPPAIHPWPERRATCKRYGTCPPLHGVTRAGRPSLRNDGCAAHLPTEHQWLSSDQDTSLCSCVPCSGRAVLYCFWQVLLSMPSGARAQSWHRPAPVRERFRVQLERSVSRVCRPRRGPVHTPGAGGVL